MPTVESRFDATSPVKLPLVCLQAFELRGQLVAERRWEAVMQAKGDALGDFAPFEVRQVAPVVPW